MKYLMTGHSNKGLRQSQARRHGHGIAYDSTKTGSVNCRQFCNILQYRNYHIVIDRHPGISNTLSRLELRFQKEVALFLLILCLQVSQNFEDVCMFPFFLGCVNMKMKV